MVKKLSGNPDYTLSIRKTKGIEPMIQNKASADKTKTINGDASSVQISHQMWTDLYAPTDIGELVGNNGVVD